MKYEMYNKSKKCFDKFINDNFDINEEKISHKLMHTYRVVDDAKYICEKLTLDETNTNIAMIIALLHDIGRFSQAKEMQTFREDITNYDHATLGVKFLFDKKEIRKYVSDSKYDEIIKKAILNHSKYKLEKKVLTKEELLHSKIIRDADKIDNLRTKVTADVYTMANISSKDIENSTITDKIYDDFMNEKSILSKDRKTGIDVWISYIAFIFDLEFKCSYELVKKKDYVNKLFDRFEYKKEKSRMKKLKEKALKYLEDNIKEVII